MRGEQKNRRNNTLAQHLRKINGARHIFTGTDTKTKQNRNRNRKRKQKENENETFAKNF